MCRNAARLRSVFKEIKPSVVFHAAAHKHLPLMEDNPEEAITNNVVGTRNVVRVARETGAERLVLVSTDKAVSPSSVMGASKRLAEAIVRAAAAAARRQFVVVRFGNVLGSRGSVVPAFKHQIEQGGPVRVTHPDVTRYFMTIPEAVHLVIEAGGMALGGELFVLNMGKPVRIVDLAKDLIQLSGFSLSEIPIVFTGLRPGEKLEERLWEDGATVEPTDDPGDHERSRARARTPRAARRSDRTDVRGGTGWAAFGRPEAASRNHSDVCPNRRIRDEGWRADGRAEGSSSTCRSPIVPRGVTGGSLGVAPGAGR